MNAPAEDVTLKGELPDGRFLFEKGGVHFSLTSRQVMQLLQLWGAVIVSDEEYFAKGGK